MANFERIVNEFQNSPNKAQLVPQNPPESSTTSKQNQSSMMTLKKTERGKVTE